MKDYVNTKKLEKYISDEFNHGIQVSNLAYYVSKKLGLYENMCYELAIAGAIHDIGKLKVAAYLYEGNEDEFGVEEMRYVRMHSRLSYEILIRYDYSDFIIESILYHHENYDGSGYPENLQGNGIPIGARVLRVCDVYAALTSDRPYRRAFDPETAVRIMIDEMKNYDMRVFLAFQQAIHEEAWKESWENPGLRVKIEEYLNDAKLG